MYTCTGVGWPPLGHCTTIALLLNLVSTEVGEFVTRGPMNSTSYTAWNQWTCGREQNRDTVGNATN